MQRKKGWEQFSYADSAAACERPEAQLSPQSCVHVKAYVNFAPVVVNKLHQKKP